MAPFTGQPRCSTLLKFLFFISLCCSILLPSTLLAKEAVAEKQYIAMAEQQMLSLFYETSSLPTRTEQSFNKLPTVMSVITAEQMREMGARDLTDVLRLIPGLQLGMGGIGYPRVTVRGMPSHGAEKLKFMVDGHNVDIALTGGSGLFFADYPIESLQKVEFLRGPGSALYGSDALLGVINIVTRKNTNRDKTALSARVGSFETQRYNLESAGAIGPVQLYGSANYLNSNGADVDVARDGLSSSPANRSISNAPGNSSEWVERVTLNLSAETEHIQFQGQYINHQDGGFFNPTMSLTDQTSLGRDYFWTNLSYENTFLNNQLMFKAKVSYNRYDHDYDILGQPAGFRNVHGVYPGGLRSITEGIVDEYGLTLQADSYSFEQHTITVGGEIKNTELYDVSTLANYDPAPLPQMQDVSSYFSWMEEAERTYYGIFLQDQYQYGEDLVVVVGGRYDYYDDFGSTFSPNLGVAYHFHQDWQFKLLYGQAFRAPSFRELYKLPAGSNLRGAPQLQAESIRTWQSGFVWKPDETLTTSITAYYNDFIDTIGTVANEKGGLTFINQPDSNSIGFELELRGKLPTSALDLSWFAAVSYADSEQSDGSERPGVASWLGSAGFDYRFADHINLNTTMYYTDEVYADPLDPRDTPENYILVDTALTIYNVMGKVHGLDLTWSIHNLFDQEYAYPETSGKMPVHFPRPGISTDFWLTYHF